MSTKEEYMRAAIAEAELAAQAGEVPIGAVVVAEEKIVGRGSNRTRRDGKVSAHAELVALEQAQQQSGDYRLEYASIYVTVEPCLMCLGAIYQSRIRQIYFGASEPKFGALGSRFDLRTHEALRKIEMKGGILAKECSGLLSSFFAELRSAK